MSLPMPLDLPRLMLPCSCGHQAAVQQHRVRGLLPALAGCKGHQLSVAQRVAHGRHHPPRKGLRLVPGALRVELAQHLAGRHREGREGGRVNRLVWGGSGWEDVGWAGKGAWGRGESFGG